MLKVFHLISYIRATLATFAHTPPPMPSSKKKKKGGGGKRKREREREREKKGKKKKQKVKKKSPKEVKTLCHRYLKRTVPINLSYRFVHFIQCVFAYLFCFGKEV